MGLSMHSMTLLPINVWGNAFLTASQIINLLLSSIIQGKTPHELLFNKKPDYTKFRSFGCACYPLLRSYNLSKLNLRSYCCLFFGYSLCNKGYICRYSIGRIYVSTYSFNEDIFPFFSKILVLSKSDDAPVSQIATPIFNVLFPSTPSIIISDHITLHTSSLHNHTSSPFVTATNSTISLSSQNIHPMTTHGKSVILKRKIYNASIVFVPSEHVNLKNAL